MKTNATCVFCKIVARTEPASIVYEDDQILGFMNNRPVHPGECLLIPKDHTDHFMDIDDVLAAKIMTVGQTLARKIHGILKAERVGYVVAGYSVPHAHFIIIPQHHAHDITSEHFAVKEGAVVSFTDQHIPLASREELDRLAKLLMITA